MNTPYICSACRRTILARLQVRHRSQWHAKAAFTAWSNRRTPADEGRKESLLDIADAKDDVTLRFPGPSARRPYRSNQDAGDILESLFEATLKNDPASTTQIQQSPSIDSYRDIEAIQKMLANRRVQRAEVWEHFVAHFEPIDREDQQAIRPAAFPAMARDLLDDIRNATKEVWMSAGNLGHIPTLTNVAKKYMELGLMTHATWNLLIRDLLCELSRQERLERREVFLASNEQVLADLLGVWQLFCLQYKNVRNRDVLAHIAPDDWSCISHITRRDVFSKSVRFPLDIVTQALFPAFPAERLRQSIACAAILTYGLLSHLSKTESSIMQAGRPFLKAIGSVIGQGWTTQSQVRDQISQYVGITNVQGRDALWKFLLGTNHGQDTFQENTGFQQVNPSAASGVRDANIQRRLNYLVEKREVRRIDAFYSATITWNDGNNFKERQLDYIELHNQFIKAYMSCRETGRAVDVWNQMIQKGLTPTVLTWTAMLEGCRISRDVQSLESVWMKLRASGIELDVVCWTTVICGLIENAKGHGSKQISVEKGMHLLEEMGRVWLEAEKEAVRSKSKVNRAAKPTIFTINGVLRSLLVTRRFDMADRLLQWGKQFRIEPDIVTYNTLLRSHIREGQAKEAQGILEEMQNSGVQADIITFTTILEETFRYSSTFTEAERTAVVDNVFTEMDKAGVEANHVTYGKIIYILLQDATQPGNISTVQSVLERMARQNIKPNQYIYTSLINYYFSREPPDLAAIEAAIAGVRQLNLSDEIVFWDRIIECYSAIGDPITALQHFGKHNRAGARVGFTALRALLQSLVENGHIDLAMQFIKDTRLDRRPRPAQRDRGSEGEHLFWDMVDDFESNMGAGVR